MNKIHLPMDFTDEEKPLVLEYLKKFKHSQLSIKMLMCAYFGGCRFREGYISFGLYIRLSLRCADTCSDKDESLKRYWHFNHQLLNDNSFFAFSKDTILNGTMNDVEKMITDWLFTERNPRPIYYQSMWLTNV